MVQRVIAVDLARVYDAPTGAKKLLTVLAWGDAVEVESIATGHVEVRVPRFVTQPDGSIAPTMVTGFLRAPKGGPKAAGLVATKADAGVLQVDFVDVQQGDAAVIETPLGKVVTLDGGDNQMFARYLANRFRGTKDGSPKEIEAMVVTHGDADHFAGLTEIHDSETNTTPRKRLFIHPKRVYHNGLVKRPEKKANGTNRKEIEMLGATKTVGGQTLITGLESNLLGVSDAEMNQPFKAWKKALAAWKKRGAIEFRRLELGDDEAFDFLADEDVRVEVLGPLPVESGSTKGLPFLGNPPEGPRLGHESLSLETAGFKGASASHTINGHSVILRLSYGRFHFVFAGDLNAQAERTLTRAHNDGHLSLRAEVLKVPHHGSADFSAAFLSAVAPIISVVSSGDESARKEFIHPRASLVGALGRYSRIEEPLIFVTELVAFFNLEGPTNPECHVMKNGVCLVDGNVARLDKKARKPFFAFSRTAYGIVKVRTDGERLLVYTNSGQSDLKEAYAYRMNDTGTPVPDVVRQV